VSLRRPASALLSRYLQQYKKQPGSRVFAPLAESYRKLGMYDDALKILREGIKRHPDYALGYLVLAQCYHDQKKNDAAYETVKPLIQKNTDNPALQKLYAQVCLELGKLDEALEGFKYLLFLNPRDKVTASQVKQLEDDLARTTPVVSANAIRKAPQTSKPFDVDEDDWALVDFSPQAKTEETSLEDQWSMQPLEEVVEVKTKHDDWKIMSRSIDDDFFSDDEVSPEDSDAPHEDATAPLASHTLVDLYVSQNHVAQAIDLLENIVALNPKDDRSIRRLAELKGEDLPAITALSAREDEGEAELLRIIEEEVRGPHSAKVEQAWRLFLQQIQLTAMEREDGMRG